MMKKLLAAFFAGWLALAPAQAANQASVSVFTSGPHSAADFAINSLNPALLAIFSCNWGPGAPANGPGGVPTVYQCWADTSASPVVTFNHYDGANWVAFGTLNTSTHVWRHSGASINLTDASSTAAAYTSTQINMTRSSSATSGAFIGNYFNYTDNGTAQAATQQILRVQFNSNSTFGSASPDSLVYLYPTFAQTNAGTFYGIDLIGAFVSSGKTIGSWAGIHINAPGGAGTVTSKTAILIDGGSGPIIQNDTTATSSPSTGSLVTGGGVGVGLGLQVGQSIGAAGSINAQQQLSTFQFVSTPAPSTKTTAYSLAATDSSLIFNSASPITLTLGASPAAGRWLYVKNIAAGTVVSASSNVAPIGSATLGTAILAAGPGKWAALQSDGTNWIIMMAN